MNAARAVGIVAVVAILGCVQARAGQDGPIIAVFDIQDRGSGLSKDTLRNLIDYLSANLAKAGYRVIPRDQVRDRLFDAKKESYKECYEQSCQIELGRELAAQKTLSTKILRIANTCQVTAELYDLLQATTDLATTAEAKCANEQSMLQAFDGVAEDLSRPLLGSRRRVENGLAELERLIRSDAGAKAERADEAWKVVEAIARDTMASKSGRIKALRRYLDAFSDVAPASSAKARKLVVDIDLATLVIMSSPPGAKVLVNGEFSGIAPVTKTLRAGEYAIRGELADHEAMEKKVELEPGEKNEISLMLKQIPNGTLVVRADSAEAWVTIDGKTSGQVPVAKELKPGEHEVEVKLAGYRIASRKVLIKADEQESWDLRLESIPSRPHIVWGHAAFWTGAGLVALGGVGLGKGLALQDDYNAGNVGVRSDIENWTGAMYGGFFAGTALIVTGVVLWVISPDIQSWAEQHNGYLGTASDGQGLVLTAGGKW